MLCFSKEKHESETNILGNYASGTTWKTERMAKNMELICCFCDGKALHRQSETFLTLVFRVNLEIIHVLPVSKVPVSRLPLPEN